MDAEEMQTIRSTRCCRVPLAALGAARAITMRLKGHTMPGYGRYIHRCVSGHRQSNHRIRQCDQGLPLAVPMLPIATVGAGGGSIAYVDNGGVLRVGPHSTGAEPGPACYGKQKTLEEWLPTVTDAHVVLGHLTELLGGNFPVFKDDALSAIQSLATTLNTSIELTAQPSSIHATQQWLGSCRRVSLEQGLDPRHLTIVAFGGAGGLHACKLAAGRARLYSRNFSCARWCTVGRWNFTSTATANLRIRLLSS